MHSNSKLSSSPWVRHGLPALGFALLVYFPLFLHLDTNPVKAWDESLFALRAYSMAYYGEYLCAFDDLPGAEPAPNMKPPLITWVQAGLFHLIGYGELALRLPIALCALGILAVLLWLSRQQTTTLNWGYWSGLVLITTPGFIHEHMARTGDHDVPLALFNLLLLGGAYRYAQAESKHRPALWLMAGAWTAGLLTKGAAALFFLPGIALYLLLCNRLWSLLRDPQAWLALGAVGLVMGAYFVYQEWQCPGYLIRMNRFEGVQHFAQSRGGHRHPWHFYLVSWYEWKFTPWLAWLLPAALLPWFPRFRPWRAVLGLLWLGLLSGTVVISLSGTKLVWYDASVLPLLAALVGFSLHALHEALQQYVGPRRLGQNWALALLLLCSLGVGPYRQIIDKVYLPQERMYADERYRFLIDRLAHSHPEIKDFAIFQLHRGNHILFYRYLYNHHQGYHIRRYKVYEEIKPGDQVMICQPDGNEVFRLWFEYAVIESYENCHLYRVEGYTERGLRDMRF